MDIKVLNGSQLDETVGEIALSMVEGKMENIAAGAPGIDKVIVKACPNCKDHSACINRAVDMGIAASKIVAAIKEYREAEGRDPHNGTKEAGRTSQGEGERRSGKQA